MAMIEIENLTRRFGPVMAVSGLSLEVARGEVLGFLGPNGAGKSTTINCLSGIATPSSGTIEVFGIDVVKNYREARRLVGLCPQEFNVDVFATPRQIVDWMGGYFGMTARQRKSRTDFLIERFEMQPHANKPFRALSGGLKRRVVLMRALVNDPKLIVLDEPTAGVDVELRRVLWRYLQEINSDGRTILLTSHYLEEVERLCRAIAIINQGRIVREGTKEDLIGATGGLEAAYLSATGAEPDHVGA